MIAALRRHPTKLFRHVVAHAPPACGCCFLAFQGPHDHIQSSFNYGLIWGESLGPSTNITSDSFFAVHEITCVLPEPHDELNWV